MALQRVSIVSLTYLELSRPTHRAVCPNRVVVDIVSVCGTKTGVESSLLPNVVAYINAAIGPAIASLPIDIERSAGFADDHRECTHGLVDVLSEKG